MLAYVLPNFEFIFENISTELPPATSLLLNLRDFISGNLYLIISFFLFLYLGVLFLYKRFSFVFDRVYFFNIPVLSKLVKNYTYYRFFLSIYIIIKSKYRFQTALNHSKKLLKNSYVKKRMEKIISQINNGVTISKAFENSKLFDELTIQLLYTAEYSNNYEKVLKDIMRLYEKRFQQSAREFTSYAEPALLLFIAGIVLWIVLAVMVPVWDLSSTL
jgi:general secretion pathway protein F